MFRIVYTFLLTLAVASCGPQSSETDRDEKIYVKLCADEIDEVVDLIGKRDISGAGASMRAANQVFGCDSEQFLDLKQAVELVEMNAAAYSLLEIYLPEDFSADPWSVREAQSNMTDDLSVYISTKSEPYAGDYGAEQATLWIRCLENTTSVIWGWEDYLGDDDPNVYTETKRMMLRLGDEEAFERFYTVSTSHDSVGLWKGSDAIPFIRELEKVDVLVARITPYGASPKEAVFDVSRLSEHLPKLKQACGWE